MCLSGGTRPGCSLALNLQTGKKNLKTRFSELQTLNWHPVLGARPGCRRGCKEGFRRSELAPARVGDAEGAGTSPGNIRAKPKRALAEMVKQKSKDSSSDPTSHQTTDQTSGFSGRRVPAAARGFSPRTRPQPAAWPTLRVFLRSVCLSLQTPCKYFRNSAKCPQCAGISPGPGRPPVPGGTPSPVAGRGCRVLPSRRRAETDRDEAGAVPALPAGAAGRGGRCSPSGARAAGEGAPGPLRPTETAFLARPCLWRGRAAAGLQQELCLPRDGDSGRGGRPGSPIAPAAGPGSGSRPAAAPRPRPARPGELDRSLCPRACPRRCHF